MNWEPFEPSEPAYGPPKPPSCPDGWQSHRWTLQIEEGAVGYTTVDCRLCSDGLNSTVDIADFCGDIPVRLTPHVERHPSGEVDAWWNVSAWTEPETPAFRPPEQFRRTIIAERFEAGQKVCCVDEPLTVLGPVNIRTPDGAIVATATAVGCTQIQRKGTCSPHDDHLCLIDDDDYRQLFDTPRGRDRFGGQMGDLTDQLPYCVFTPGRYAVYLTDVQVGAER